MEVKVIVDKMNNGNFQEGKNDDPVYGLTDEELFELGKRIHAEKIINAGGRIEKLKSSDEYYVDGPQGEIPTGTVEQSEVEEIDNTYERKKHTTFRAGEYVISGNQPVEGFCRACGQPVIAKKLFTCGVCHHGFCGDHVHISMASEGGIVRCDECLRRGQRIFLTAAIIGLGLLASLFLVLH